MAPRPLNSTGAIVTLFPSNRSTLWAASGAARKSASANGLTLTMETRDLFLI